MTDQRLEEGAERLLRAARAANLPDELVHAFLAILNSYIDRATMIVAGQQVHRPARVPPPGATDEDSYTGR